MSKIEDVTRYRITFTEEMLYFLYRRIGSTSQTQREKQYGLPEHDAKELGLLYNRLNNKFPGFTMRRLKEEGADDET